MPCLTMRYTKSEDQSTLISWMNEKSCEMIGDSQKKCLPVHISKGLKER